MSYVIEKQEIKKFEVVDMLRFMKYDIFTNARKGMRNTPRTCFNCGHRFVGSDWIYLGVVKGDKNRVFCETCGEHIRKCLDWQQPKEG